MTHPTESYNDRMNRCADALIALTSPDDAINAIELYAIFNECTNIYLIPILHDCIRSDSDIDEMTYLLDPDDDDD